MNKPKSIKDYANEKGNQPNSLLKEFLELIKENIKYHRYNCCAICDEKLNLDELKTISYKDINFTCFKHREYSQMFNSEKIRIDLGYKYSIDIFEI